MEDVSSKDDTARFGIVLRDFIYRIGGVMVSVLASSAVDRGFGPRSGQIKDYKIGICCFSAKHTALRRKSNDWLARHQDNVSKWGDMSIRGLVSVSWHYKNPTKCVGLVQRGPWF